MGLGLQGNLPSRTGHRKLGKLQWRLSMGQCDLHYRLVQHHSVRCGMNQYRDKRQWHLFLRGESLSMKVWVWDVEIWMLDVDVGVEADLGAKWRLDAVGLRWVSA